MLPLRPQHPERDPRASCTWVPSFRMAYLAKHVPVFLLMALLPKFTLVRLEGARQGCPLAMPRSVVGNWHMSLEDICYYQMQVLAEGKYTKVRSEMAALTKHLRLRFSTLTNGLMAAEFGFKWVRYRLKNVEPYYPCWQDAYPDRYYYSTVHL